MRLHREDKTAATVTTVPLWAVVPVKNMRQAKQRLAPLLTAEERHGLFRAMLEDVLAALQGVDALAGILVVTPDAEARVLAQRHGARVLDEPCARGHTAAAILGARTLAAEGAAGMLQLPADIPLVGGGDIRALLQAHALTGPAVTLAPSRDERGSNAVACSPPDALPLAFGDNSFYPHLRRARELGIAARVVRRGGLALDVDTPADLEAFLATPSDTRAYAYLARRDIAARFGG